MSMAGTAGTDSVPGWAQARAHPSGSSQPLRLPAVSGDNATAVSTSPLGGVTIAQGGVLPNIQAVLLPKKSSATVGPKAPAVGKKASQASQEY